MLKTKRQPRVVKPPLNIAHVGDINNDRDIMIRVVSIDWIAKNRHDVLEGKKPQHDFLDLHKGRDFLAEDKQYNVVVLHFLWASWDDRHRITPDFANVPDIGPQLVKATAVSPLHSREKWNQRLIATGADVIIAFGGGTEVASAYIGDIPDYSHNEVFGIEVFPGVQFGVWQRNRS